MDLFGLDRFQERLRAVDVLTQWEKMVSAWHKRIQEALVFSSTESIGFSEVDSLVEQIVRELGPKLQLVNREKKKYRDQVKVTHECLTVPPDPTPFSNPQPTELKAKRKRKEERRVRKKKPDKEVCVEQVVQEGETVITPEQQLVQELNQLEYLLQQT